MIALAALALLVHAAPSSASVPGVYVTDQMEMAGGLELQANGHFRYQFDYGAVSESAEGRWTFDGSTVRLTSDPMPKEPDFALVSGEPAPAGEIYVAIEDSRSGTWTPLTVEARVDGIDHPLRIDANDDGRLEAPAGHHILAVKMLLPANETGGSPVQIDAGHGHRLLFRLEPNDIGAAAFRGEPLTLDGTAMVMHHYDTEIVFRRAKR